VGCKSIEERERKREGERERENEFENILKLLAQQSQFQYSIQHPPRKRVIIWLHKTGCIYFLNHFAAMLTAHMLIS
jgi:hypothetical protein